MSKLIKKLVLFLIPILICGMFTACTPNANEDNGLNNATFYDRVEKYAYETYLQENKTQYPFDGSDLPYDRVNVIRTQEELDKAILEGHIDIDFDKEIVILYFFTDYNAGFGCRLQSIKIKDNQLNIVIFHNLADKNAQGLRPPSSSRPTQRCVAIKTSLIDFDNVYVTMTGPD